jgi:hypothetical protein
MLKTIVFSALFLVLGQVAQAADFYIVPGVSVGHNEVQGTHTTFGLDIGVHYDENIDFGVGGYFGAGEHPEHDREMGVGPFASYAYPIAKILTAKIREDISWVDVNIPIETVSASGSTYTHENETGVISSTSLGLHLSFTQNFGISAGYRIVVALANEDLDDDRSGYFFGLTIGI